MKKQLSILFLFLWVINGFAQVITTNPQFPTADNAITITFDAAQGSQGLMDYSGDIYAHIGVITENSTSGGDWKYVKTDWNENIPETQMNKVSENIYTLEITPNVKDYFGVPEGEKILQIAIVFRNEDGSLQGKETSGGDIYADISDDALQISITKPFNLSVYNQASTVEISASASEISTLKLYVDGVVISETTGTEISTNYDFENGDYSIKAEAISGENTVQEEIYICIKEDVIIEAKPTEYHKGINYIDDNTAALVLWAPDKDNVFVIGDFNNWRPTNSFQMKKDGDTFWMEIDGLEKGKQYVFQYLIDGELKLADPYTEQVSDPWNDGAINDTTYPDLVAYPDGKANGLASVLQTGQSPYQWEVTDFTTPEKGKLIIYELLVRDFTESHSYKGVIEKLDYLEDLGINALELMPVNEFEGNSSWGYNPSFYFAPDKYYGHKNDLKKLIDECHKRGIAIIIDMVLNHSFGQSPIVQMYWDKPNNRPAANNPWYNTESNFKNPDAQWGYDFNHESEATRAFVDSVNTFWLTEYKVDGFRFDFTKGFSNTIYSANSWGSPYDADRIAILKRMSDEIWKCNSDAIISCEHLSDNTEETELANYGLFLWGNMNNNYGESAMAYNESNKSDLSWGVYSNRSWTQPNLITYMESHDEERLTYKCTQWGNISGTYSIKEIPTALERMQLNSVFLLPLPGPKMIWQFGELGYDISIDENGRTGEKPIKWEYFEDANRKELYQLMANLNSLKQNYEAFVPDQTEFNLRTAVKSYTLSNGDNHVVVVGNFDVTEQATSVSFPTDGTWYDMTGKQTVNIANNSLDIKLAPGKFKIYSTTEFELPFEIITSIKKHESNSNISVFPNPATSKINITASEINKIEFYNIYGQLAKQTVNSSESNNSVIDVSDLSQGIYLIKVIDKQQNSSTIRFCKD